MSRCFPFPPPGYEKKIIHDDVNLIIKEKNKKKKRKDKGSRRKPKEKSEDRHGEDKGKKRKKNRDKKGKKKDIKRASGDEKVVQSVDNHNAEKLASDCKPVVGDQDTRILLELGKRVGNDGGEIDNRMVHLSMEQEGPNSLEKVAKNNDGLLAYNKDRKGSENVSSRQLLKVDANGFGNGLIGSFYVGNQTRVEADLCEAEKLEKRKEWNDKNKHGKNEDKEAGYKNEDRHKSGKEEKKRKRKEEKERKMKKEKERKMKKEKDSVSDRRIVKIKPVANGVKVLDFNNNIPSNPLKESHASHGEPPKHKEVVANGFMHEDGIRSSNMSKLAPSPLRVCRNGNGFELYQHGKTLAVEKGSAVRYQKSNGWTSPSQPVNVKNMALAQNGCISTSENGRAPVTNHVCSNGSISSKYVDNGRKVEPCEANMEDVRKMENGRKVVNGRKIVKPEIDSWQLPDSQGKMDNRSLRISMSKSKQNTSSIHSSAFVKTHDNGGSSVKLPHPDSDHLSQILTVPALEWPQSDDQEWLFGSRDSQTKRTRLTSTLVDCTKQVWAEALPLDSADVTALPFVIPY